MSYPHHHHHSGEQYSTPYSSTSGGSGYASQQQGYGGGRDAPQMQGGYGSTGGYQQQPGGMSTGARPARTVMVDILEGRNLANVELLGKVDPYCMLLAGSDKIKTRVHKDGGSNLAFNDTAELAVGQGVDDVLLEVYDYNHVRGDKLIGRGRVSVADAKFAGRVEDTWVELHDDRGRTTGEVHVKVAPRYVRRREWGEGG
ncbi:hypothetical protein AMAG_02661 [Allomyces macrogynus ATCC 38327]|uniref:C2 domain-containing protein n=1 Tax=Allomyces macrogynus (strain ATCC 38327) TaxID=578462 RepID=A0A0L0S399_ALLM3|nr:hypothetical protein AMAG_02661 [Allomyces macrogynus ATCC 38327]|eukprot:KNE56890.1 hypothetical protein AMAG_02661 [Allomyces macrogynus ATCC 38327]